MPAPQSEEESGFRGWRESEEARLAREKRVLEKQSKALLKVRGPEGRGGSQGEMTLSGCRHQPLLCRMGREGGSLTSTPIHPTCLRVIKCAKLTCIDMLALDHALTQLPTKKERSAVEAVEAVLEAERKEGRAREARHKLTVERLRRQLLEQQVHGGGGGQGGVRQPHIGSGR
jgi:hypothetical protein